MFAGVVHAREDIRYEEIQTPSPKKGEVLVKVKYTGICGSDIPRVNGDACHYFPNVLGHEFSGEIVEVGEGVENRKVGERVAGVPLVPCMKCEDCAKGNFSLCKHYGFIGSRQFGSFAEYVVLPETNVFPFADEVTYQQAALFEPSTVSLHGVLLTDYKGGGNVLVVGCGTIGLFAIQWARILGAKSITAVDIYDEQLELAKRLGATESINSLNEDWKAQVMALTEDKGYDYVFDATGNSMIMKDAFGFAINRGTVCFIGTPKRDVVFTVDEWEQLNRRELKVTGSWMSYSAPFPGKEWEMTAHYFHTGELIYDEAMIYETLPLSRIAEAFEWYKEPGKVRGKILISSEG